MVNNSFWDVLNKLCSKNQKRAKRPFDIFAMVKAKLADRDEIVKKFIDKAKDKYWFSI